MQVEFSTCPLVFIKRLDEQIQISPGGWRTLEAHRRFLRDILINVRPFAKLHGQLMRFFVVVDTLDIAAAGDGKFTHGRIILSLC